MASVPDAAGRAIDATIADVVSADGRTPDLGVDLSARREDAGTALTLTSTGFLVRGADSIFPASACYPMDHSPPFAWSGAPAGTKSFALTFVDKSNGATKWVIWDLPAATTILPGDLSNTEHPSEIPIASQRGSLGRTGYSGPGVRGPPMHVYEFVLWALDVEKLPDTTGRSTVELLQNVLPVHAIGGSRPLVAKGQLGGP